MPTLSRKQWMRIPKPCPNCNTLLLLGKNTRKETMVRCPSCNYNIIVNEAIAPDMPTRIKEVHDTTLAKTEVLDHAKVIPPFDGREKMSSKGVMAAWCSASQVVLVAMYPPSNLYLKAKNVPGWF